MRIPTLNMTPLLLACLWQGVFLTGCSQGEAPQTGAYSAEAVPVQIGSVALASDVATRGVIPVTSGSIGVFNTTATKGYSKAFNVNYTYAGGVWNSTTPIYMAGNYIDLCAYHPLNAAVFTAGTTTFDLSAQVYVVAKDMSYAPVSSATHVNNWKPNATFAMTRAYAQFSLEITRQASYTGACKITNITLKRPTGNLQSVRTLDIGNSTYTDKTPVATLSYTNLGTMQTAGITTVGVANTDFHLLLPPQPLPAGMHIQLTIDGALYALPINQAQLSAWVAGQNQVVDISVSGTGVAIATVSTNEWVQGSNPPPGNGSVIQP